MMSVVVFFFFESRGRHTRFDCDWSSDVCSSDLTQANRPRHHEREIANLGATVKTRFWADPWVPGQTRLTVEPVYRPRYDPSRPERDLELIAPKEHQGYKIARRFVDKLKERFGVPNAAR